jgi:CHASE3 domain sensor protein
MGRRHVASRTCIRNDPADAVEGDPAGGGVQYICHCLGALRLCRRGIRCQPDSAARQLWLGPTHKRGASQHFGCRESHSRSRVGRARGYLLTGESSYLNSYNRSQADIPRLLEALRQAVFDNPSQIHRLDELRPTVEARLAEFGQIVELGPMRLSEALAMLQTARSRQLTVLIEEQLGQFRQSEVALLGERQQRADRDTILATLIATAMAVLAMLSAAMGAFLLRDQRSTSQLRVANEQLSLSHAHLRSILETVPDAMVVIDERGIIQSSAQPPSACSESPLPRFNNGMSAC